MVDVYESCLGAVRTAKCSDDPFVHILFERFFTPALYEGLLSQIPNTELFYALPHPDALRADGTSTRRVFELSPGNIRKLGQMGLGWASAAEILHSEILRRTIFKQLGPAIAARLKISVADAETLVAFPRCALTEDSAGFRISVHPDWHTKLVTVQLYLAADATTQGLGTHFYRGESTPFMTPTYRPNSGYAFVVDKHSWHSREPLPALPRKRFTLALTYFLDPPEPYTAETY